MPEVFPNLVIDNSEASASDRDQRADSQDGQSEQFAERGRTPLSSPVNSGAGNGIAEKAKPYPNCEFDDVEECDLIAQQSMAYYTRLMNCAAWAGVFLTVIGLTLLTRTMIYTRDAAEAAAATVVEAKKATQATLEAARSASEGNKLTREIFVESERPRLALSGFTVKQPLTLKDDKWRMSVIFKAKNTGKSAAVGVMFWAKLVPLKINGDYTVALAAFMAEKSSRLVLDNIVTQGAEHPSPSRVLALKTAEVRDAASESERGYVTPIIVGFIEYEFTFDATRRYTPFILLGAGNFPLDAESGAVMTLNFAQLPSPIRPT